jgi:lipopolysaccharide export system permease protein
MSGFQRYLFRIVLRALVAILAGLALIALLTQGLSQIDLLVESRRSAAAYLWVSLLASPQIFSLLIPLALFVATVVGLNTAHRENEIVVAEASGMSNWAISSPVIRLAVLASLLHLGLILWLQPAASREMRETLSESAADLASSLVREGAFFRHSDGLTTFARRVDGDQMIDLLVSDARNPDQITTYIAKSGYLADMAGVPALVMSNGHVQQLDQGGALERLAFEQSVFDLAPFVAEQKAFVLKETDRYLPELFYPDRTNYYDSANVDRLLAEAHSRLSAPLLNIAMALLAIYAVLGGEFSRRGYARRIAIASAAALLLRLGAFGAVAAAQDDSDLNIVQYLIPTIVIAAVSYAFFIRPDRPARRMSYAGLEPGAVR